MNPNWYQSFFHGIVNELWRKAVSADQTREEAAFIEKTLGSRTRLLDVPCGNGRHALELAKRGCRITGVDVSWEFIQEARAAATADRVAAEFLQANIRDLNWNAEFDGAFCFGNSFGYLEFADMTAFVKGTARALKPGGTFVIETGMAAESILPALKEREWYQIDDIIFAIQNRYMADVSCLETEAVFVRDGKSESRTWWHWVYTVGEIRRMLEGAGLKVINTYSSLNQQPFKLGDQRLFVIAKKLT
jgi:SAM-dependent methyltransferase